MRAIQRATSPPPQCPKGQVRVADFGLARPTETASSLTGSGSFAGSPHYVSPEQARGEDVDFRCDLYSLGIVVYEMATGQRPFEGASVALVVSRQLTEPVPSIRKLRPEAPEWLAALTSSLTQKDPARRPPSHDEIIHILDHEATLPDADNRTLTVTGAGRAATTPVRPQSWRTRLVAALLLSVALAAGWWAFSNRRPPGATVVVVAPFASEDPSSITEGRTMAALVQDEIERGATPERIFVVGPDLSDRTPGTESAARKLLVLEQASFVVWGRVFRVEARTEIEARLTTASGLLPPPSWPDGVSVDNSTEGLLARRSFARQVAAAIKSIAEPPKRP